MTQPRAVTFTQAPGGVETVDLPAETLDQASLALPRGAYTTLRTYGGDGFLRLGYHLARLDESTCLLGQRRWLDHGAIRAGLRDVLSRTHFPESRVRITVGLPAGGEPARVYFSVEPFEPPPPEIYERGVRTITRRLEREAPRAKDTGFIAPSRNVKSSLPSDVYEILMVDPQDRILEGITSNFFGVLDGVLRTAGAGVLEGVTRSLVLEIAARRMPVHLEPISVAEIPRLAEAFITSSTREVVPVAMIDGAAVGSGTPGRVTREILSDFRARVLDEAQPA